MGAPYAQKGVIMRIKIRKYLWKVPIVAILTAIAFIMLLPIAWMICSAFKADPEIISYPPTFFPEHFTLKNIDKVQSRINIAVLIKNSMIYALGQTVPSLLVNTLAGYAFARYEFKGKNMIFIIYLATMMIPFQVIMIPLFLEVHALGMYNNYAGLIIPRIASAYWIFMMRSAFEGLPRELEEAARIDGLSEFGIYGRIMIPLIKPAMITLVILNINGSWNDLLWPLIVTSTNKMKTLSNGLALFIGKGTEQYGAAFMGGAISLLPMLILYIFGQRYFVEGQATSGLKG